MIFDVQQMYMINNKYIIERIVLTLLVNFAAGDFIHTTAIGTSISSEIQFRTRVFAHSYFGRQILDRKKSETENGPRFDMTKMMLRRFIFPNSCRKIYDSFFLQKKIGWFYFEI